jgi:folate-binding protein YgfZ
VDRAAFLHGQCTNSIVGQPVGAVVDACVPTAQGRVVDLITACVGADCIRVVASAARVPALAGLFNKHIFPMDRVSVATADLAIFSLVGPGALAAAHAAVAEALVDAAGEGGAAAAEVETASAAGVTIAPGSGLGGAAGPGNGATLLVPRSAASSLAGAVWRLLAASPAVGRASADLAAWAAARVAAGRPEADAEFEAVVLVPPPNLGGGDTRQPGAAEKPKLKKSAGCLPLELGLFHAVDFAKGCYMGQETIAKVAGQDAVRRELWGLAWEKEGDDAEARGDCDAKDGGKRPPESTAGIAVGSRIVLLPEAGSDSNGDARSTSSSSEGGLLGTVTSVAPAAYLSTTAATGELDASGAPPSAAVALALVKRSAAHAGRRVRVLPPLSLPMEPATEIGEVPTAVAVATAEPVVHRGRIARLVDLPFASRSLFQAAAPPAPKAAAAAARAVAAPPASAPARAEAAPAAAAPPVAAPAASAAAEAERKRAKLAAMEAKLAAFKRTPKDAAATAEPTAAEVPATEDVPEDVAVAEAARKALKLAANQAKLDALMARKRQKTEGE